MYKNEKNNNFRWGSGPGYAAVEAASTIGWLYAVWILTEQLTFELLDILFETNPKVIISLMGNWESIVSKYTFLNLFSWTKKIAEIVFQLVARS